MSGKRLRCLVFTVVPFAVAVWVFVLYKNTHDMALFRLNEAARAVAAYMTRSSGAWPASLGDLEQAGILRRETPDSFVVVVRGDVGGIPERGPLRVIIHVDDVAIGWGAVPVDSSGNLIALKGLHGWFAQQRARYLSQRLRELSEEMAAQRQEVRDADQGE